MLPLSTKGECSSELLDASRDTPNASRYENGQLMGQKRQKGRFQVTAPSRSSPVHFLSLPLEVRQLILSNLMQYESTECLEPHLQVALPFERPVIYMHDLEWLNWARSPFWYKLGDFFPFSYCIDCDRPLMPVNSQPIQLGTCWGTAHSSRSMADPPPMLVNSHLIKFDTYWGTAHFSRLFAINWQIYEEMKDLVYSQFAFFTVPWSISNQQNLSWRDLLMKKNPGMIAKIYHHQLCLTLDGAPGVTEYTKLCPERLDFYTALRIGECQELLTTFPNIKSIALQIHYNSTDFETDSETDVRRLSLLADQIVHIARFWKDRGVRALVFSGPCVQSIGRQIVRIAQEKLGQRQKNPKNMIQTKSCGNASSTDDGCGRYQCQAEIDRQEDLAEIRPCLAQHKASNDGVAF
jgi:hypothetical protein